MNNEIQLLSDHIANQIAAGEVIQRPASAVKEMLENAIDAHATEIQLIIKDAGKELIQVIDNGCGMSVTDARMSFERHATSKIRHIEDLFKIRTMGFRGEALASIAAVAKVEMKTRRHDSDMGTRICIEATSVLLQEPCAMVPGTNLMIKNLFYNIPARRHFLKSNTTELRHIWDEFSRVALANPQVSFRFRNNGEEQKYLEAGNLKTRIVGLLGNNYEKNMVPVEEETALLRIRGFIGKPESATKTRGMQFFFINNRFIRSPYLNHAITTAFEGLIAKESFPFYVLMLETDPAKVDVNVHPTKQEVKFDDDRLMYTYLSAAVKHALARYNIAPSLDFTLNPQITQLPAVNFPLTEQQTRQTEKGYLYNTFSQKNQAHIIDPKNSVQHWKELYAITQKPADVVTPVSEGAALHPEAAASATTQGHSLLIQDSLLITTVKSGLMLINIRRAQERICYDRLAQQQGTVAAQKLLFPVTCELPPADAVLLQEILPELQQSGFDMSGFGQHTFVIQAVPAGLPAGEERSVLDEMLDQLKHTAALDTSLRTEKLRKRLAKRMAGHITGMTTPEQQQLLIDELFSCTMPEYAPDGKKIFTLISKEALEDML